MAAGFYAVAEYAPNTLRPTHGCREAHTGSALTTGNVQATPPRPIAAIRMRFLIPSSSTVRPSARFVTGVTSPPLKLQLISPSVERPIVRIYVQWKKQSNPTEETEQLI